MSGAFKVQKLSQTNSLLKTQTIKPKQNLKKDSQGQVILSISTIPILKYSSHALIQILSSFFDNTQTLPLYHQIQKALKIVSLTENDDVLFSDIENLISKNMHKKKDVHAFICLWCQYISVSAIIQKFSNQKIREKIIYTILFVHISEYSSGIKWYQNLSFKDQISQLLSIKLLSNSKIIEEIDAQISYLRIQIAKHFRSVVMKLISLTSFCQSVKISTQFQKMLINFLKNVKNSQFLDLLAQKFISKQQGKSVHIIQQLIHYFTQNNLKEGTQIIKNSINKALSKKHNSEDNQKFFNFVQEIFEESIKEKVVNYLYEALRNWFSSLNQNLLWEFFNKNFVFKTKISSSVQRSQIIQKRNLMLQVFSQLSKQNQKMEKEVQRIIFSRYIFQFFEGKPFNFGIQSQFLQNRSKMRFESERQIMIKVLKQIKNERFLNVMTFNKSSFPTVLDWQVNPSLKQMSKKYSNLNALKKLINQVNEYWQKLEEQMLRENKKIELIFSVLKITIDKNTIFLTVSQLAELLKQVYQGKPINISQMNMLHYRNQYQPVQGKEDIKKNKSILIYKQQQIHPIILQAKIVKLLKKTLKKATILQISKSLNLEKQKTHQAVKKLVNKGFLEQNQDQTYSYEP